MTSNQDQYFDTSGELCPDSDIWVAKKISHQLSEQCFVMANRITRKLFHPIANSVEDLNSRRGLPPDFGETQVRETFFNAYIDFLKTKNDLKYNQANAYRR